MSSPLSIISDLVMRDLEERALETLGFSLPSLFYLRYVDDMLADSVKEILNIFNGLAEIYGELLNFLDVTIIKNKNYLVTTIKNKNLIINQS